VRRLLAKVDAEPELRLRDADLRQMGLDPVRVRRHFRRNYGMTFQAFARARRLGEAFDRLRRGAALDDVVFGHGYESHSGFRDAFSQVVGSPPGRARALENIRLERIETPLGTMVAGAVDRGVCFLEFSDRKGYEGQFATLRRRFGGPVVPGRSPHLARLREELAGYFAGRRRRFDVPLVFPGTPFQERVWKELCRVPYGATRSYEEIARAIGSPGAIRAVGRANGQNRIAILLPCHRVVNKSGALGGYGGGLRRKEFLLRLERGERSN
jgi:AraC family transcriptional regulator of adaptative response/methylated-DNA-[protein]-cysteine methyltransferase